MVGSCNLTKKNLGFRKFGDSGRSNTETLYLSDDLNLIKSSKEEFGKLFEIGEAGLD